MDLVISNWVLYFNSKINNYNLGIINLDLKNKIAQKENELVDLKYELP